MWTCKKCGRIFQKQNQPHSCKKISIEEHFKNKDYSKSLYTKLITEFKDQVGKVKIISLPCCIHWFGTYDFIALLPKKDKLEIRFALNEKLEEERIFAVVPLSQDSWKNCLYIYKPEEIDNQLMQWLKRSYEMAK